MLDKFDDNAELSKYSNLYRDIEDLEQKLEMAMEMANRFILSNADFALAMLKDAFQISKKEELTEFSTRLVLKIAEVYNSKNNVIHAVDYMEDSISEYVNGNLNIEAYHLLNILGFSYQRKYKLVASFSCYHAAFLEAKNQKDAFNTSAIIGNLGVVYCLIGYYEKAVMCFKESMIWLKKYIKNEKVPNIDQYNEKYRDVYMNLCSMILNIINAQLISEKYTSVQLNEIGELYQEFNQYHSIINEPFIQTFYDLSLCVYYTRKEQFEIAKKYLDDAEAYLIANVPELKHDLSLRVELFYYFKKKDFKGLIEIVRNYFNYNLENKAENINVHKTGELLIYQLFYNALIGLDKKNEAKYLCRNIIEMIQEDKSKLYLLLWAAKNLSQLGEPIDLIQYQAQLEEYKIMFGTLNNFEV